VRLVEDPSLRRRMGSAARSRYEVQFEPAAAAGRMLQIYRELITARPGVNAIRPLARAIR
jgi:glycosyltransferase involved in cell wall biosynthesis